MKKMILTAGLFIVILAGCKKDKDCDLSRESIVGSYRLTALTYQEAGSSIVSDVYNQYLPPCERDDVYTFNTNGSAVITDAGTSCVPSGGYNANWSLSGNVLNFDGDNYTVAAFDCSSMVVTINDPSAPGDVYTFTYLRL